MTDPHALHARIVERTGDWVDATPNPQAYRAAVLAVLHLHRPAPALAYVVPQMYGEGRCGKCEDGEPDAVYDHDFPSPNYGTTLVHQHGTYPWCASNCGMDDQGSEPDCQTLTVIADALGVPVDAAASDG